jgi:hypothetical protein
MLKKLQKGPFFFFGAGVRESSVDIALGYHCICTERVKYRTLCQLTLYMMGYGLDGQNSILGKQIFSILSGIQTGSGDHPASYPTSAGDCVSEVKAATA